MKNLLPIFLFSILSLPSLTSQIKNSVLNQGEIYKLTVKETGIYKLDKSFFDANSINLSSVNPKNIKVYGNGGGTVPELISSFRNEDLVENPIFVSGENDGTFDSGDFVLFYGQGPDVYHSNGTRMVYDKNIYDDENFYFLVISDGAGKRIESIHDDANPIPDPNQSFSGYNKILRYERDIINLLGAFGPTHGTGQRWFGEILTNETSKDFSSQFTIPTIVPNTEVKIKAVVAARSSRDASFDFLVNNNTYEVQTNDVDISDIEDPYADMVYFEESISNLNNLNTLRVSFDKEGISTAEAWLDYVEIDAIVPNRYSGEAYHFSVESSMDDIATEYNINSAIPIEIWDVTQPYNAQFVPQEYLNSTVTLIGNTDFQLKKYFAFNASSNALSPLSTEKIDNQNIHAIDDAEFVIIYHPLFKEAAERLQEHRRVVNPISTEIVDINLIYNEFSSGRCDPVAIRDFTRYLRSVNSNFNYLLLLGDGTYDYKNIGENNLDQNFIPVYETVESIDPINGFPSDDFYALISDHEGLPNLRGALDIAIGRLPVQNLEEANDMVDKIIHYETAPETFGDWRLRVGFTADDEDSNLHVNQADEIARKVEINEPVLNQEKVYFDAFQQESTPGGERYPQAEKTLNENLFKGQLILNYLGHGGNKGWAQERVLKLSDIESWNNPDKMPVIITATCSFTSYDDPTIVSAGEEAILKKNSGAIALFTTTRAVYASQNKLLTEATFDTIFSAQNGVNMRLGEILRSAKNSFDTSRVNSRKFALMGDPTLRLAFPQNNITIDKINGKDLEEIELDTFGALQRIEIKGRVTDYANNFLSDFNGKLDLTLFDKPTEISTLKNDNGSLVKNFTLRNSILFKGSASVINGEYAIDFYLPQDIDFSFGNGKISMYATDEVSVDAAGYYDGIKIGGSNQVTLDNDAPPTVELFMNTFNFKDGGITSDSPILLAQIDDDYGINLSGTSIGHDLTAIIDGKTENTIILNNFFEPETDNFTKGIVRFPLTDLEPGLHTLEVKAWDIANNSGLGSLNFRVVEENSTEINTYAFPNPSVNDPIFAVEHDMAGQDLEINLEIYSTAGQLIREYSEIKYAAGFREKLDFGTNLASGIYLFKVKLRSLDGNEIRESDFSKFVKI